MTRPPRAANSAAKAPSAMPARPPASATVSVTRAASASSPPKYRDGPRVATAQTPGRTISTRGQNASTDATTGSKARASPSGSWATSCSPGQRASAWRRRNPRRTPPARAAAEHATTRLANSTATGSSAENPAAVTGQSGHHRTKVRVISPECLRDLLWHTQRIAQTLLDAAVRGREPERRTALARCRTAAGDNDIHTAGAQATVTVAQALPCATQHREADVGRERRRSTGRHQHRTTVARLGHQPAGVAAADVSGQVHEH